MAPYRIMLIHPGAGFSTHDVFTGLRAGLEANGVEVISYPLDEALSFFGTLIQLGVEAKVFSETPNAIAYASQPSIGPILNTQPDAVISVSAHNWHMSVPALFKGLKAPRIPMVAYFTESPYFAIEHEIAPAYDVIFTNERAAVKVFDHPNVHYLAHAYNPNVHKPGGADLRFSSDLFYVGSGFRERVDLLRGVNWDGINFECHGFLWNVDAGALNINDILPNEETASWYRSAKICLNHHRTTTTYNTGGQIEAGSAESLNPRAYEIAACGAFQLCDDSRAERFDVFGDSLAIYKAGDSASLEQSIRYWLKHEDEREAKACAQHEAILPHTWTARAKQMLEVIFA